MDIFDVSAALLERGGAMSAKKLYKLTYYAQAWYLTISGESLFNSEFEGWTYGPVAPILFTIYQSENLILDPKRGESRNLTPEANAIVNLVLSHYGQLSGSELSAITHSEDPWIKSREGLTGQQRGNLEITLESMIAFYSTQELSGLSASEIASVGLNFETASSEKTAEIIQNMFASLRSLTPDESQDSPTERYTVGEGTLNDDEFNELASLLK